MLNDCNGTVSKGGSRFSPPDQAGGLTESLFEALLAEQRSDWSTGKRIPVDERLRQRPGLAADSAQRAELVYHEYLLRRELGESPDWQDYLRRFSEDAAALSLLREADEIVGEVLTPFEEARQTAAEFSDYELLEEIGHGGMGIVFKARQRRLDRIVALKMIRAGEYADDEERKRFDREAQAVARLQHPNIIQIHEVGEVRGQPFLALEFVAGESLARRLNSTPLPAREAAALLEVLARAMHHAHEKGVIHRDLKPSNVLLAGTPETRSEECVPKITDFGLAKRLDQARDTKSRTLLGTPSYMAPEQAEYRPAGIDRRTDVYGLGAVLYEVLTGRPPFQGESPLATLQQVAQAEPARPRLLNPAVPRDLETICLKCLEKERGRRYPSAQALADDLRRFLLGEPIHARRVGALERGWRWCRRKPMVASLLASLILVVLGVFFTTLSLWRQADAARKDAVASEEATQQLLAEVIQFSHDPSLRLKDYSERLPNMDVLLKAEHHCKSLLLRNPGNTELRVALTRVRGCLGTLCCQRGGAAETEAWFQAARDLWEPLARQDARNTKYRSWLATTHFWQASAFHLLGHIAQAVEFVQRADALWEELAEEQPSSLVFLQELEGCRLLMVDIIGPAASREEAITPLEESSVRLNKLVRADSTNRVLRKRLALISLVLGKSYHERKSASQAASYWHEAYDHYHKLNQSPRDDLEVEFRLALCCSRLMRGESPDPYYSEAISLLEHICKRLSSLLEGEQGRDWLCRMLLANNTTLALCHWKAGRTTQAEQTYANRVRPLVMRVSEHPTAQDYIMSRLATMVYLGSGLRDANQVPAALTIARDAEALANQYANLPWSSSVSRRWLVSQSLNLSAVLCQLGVPDESLLQAEQAKRILESLRGSVPTRPSDGELMSAAWVRIAKARWDLSQADEAMAAFRESAAVQRRLFEEVPTRANRMLLSRRYDQLAYWSSLRGDRAGVAEAILKRVKLWPGDVKRLQETSQEFRKLADAVSRDRQNLTPAEQTERQRYLDQSVRLAREADLQTSRREK
jgi:tRNA A-37 threonylcarbamoyl transferase component Bud32/tetratricopeptide (TPR) repeat protein